MVDFKKFPLLPGVYFFKNKDNAIIYVGKAASLRERIRSYFQKDVADLKVTSIIAEYATIDCVVTNTETEALLLEASLIREHQPKYNVLLKDGQPFIYILFTAGPIPEVKIVRNRKLKGRYFGPFIMQKMQVRKMHAYLLSTFRLKLCKMKLENGCLNYHLGNCAGNCMPGFDVAEYQFRVQLAIDALTDNQKEFKQRIKEKIDAYVAQLAFEKAKTMHEYLRDADAIFRVLKVRFTERKYADQVNRIVAPKPGHHDFTLLGAQLQEFLGINKEIHTIDCFDISHFQSQSIVGSCVRFTNGVPDKKMFRHFNIKTLTQQNDYQALQEIVARRYRDGKDVPDLILIDGGKGQLSSVVHLVPGALFISLAKAEETIFQVNDKEGKKLDLHTGVGKLLIALRDYAHHFAVSFHRKKRSTALKNSF